VPIAQIVCTTGSILNKQDDVIDDHDSNSRIALAVD
jgi:hypothetical protein